MQKTGQELELSGFVTDEHGFAPYREAIPKHARDIGIALHEHGWKMDVQSGFLSNHPAAGYSYFTYNPAKFGDSQAAQHAVSEWLDRKYAN
jgi:hypothetical protein